MGVESGQFAWTRHAIVSLMLDLLETELKATPHDRPAAAAAATAAGAQQPLLPVSPTSAASYIAASSSSSASASKPPLPQAAASASGSSFASPDTPAGAQQAIEALLADVTPYSLSNCQLDLDTRKKCLRSLSVTVCPPFPDETLRSCSFQLSGVDPCELERWNGIFSRQ